MNNWDSINHRFEIIKNLESKNNFIPPNLKTIICAENTALCLEQKKYPPPYNLYPGDNQEIIFEWNYDILVFKIEIKNECAELFIYFDCRLIFRQKLQNCVL